MTAKKKRLLSLIITLSVALIGVVYIFINSVPTELTHLDITNGESLTLEVGSTVDLDTNADDMPSARIHWLSDGTIVSAASLMNVGVRPQFERGDFTSCVMIFERV